MNFEGIVKDLDLKDEAAGIRVKCVPCPHCGEAAVVDLAEDEWNWLSQGMSPSQALSSREPAFRELFITGLHEHCWTAYLGGDEEW